MRGIKLDQTAATEAIKLCAKEVERLDGEMQEITGGEVLGGSKRIPFRKWVNGQIVQLAADGCNIKPIPDTKADTLSFALYGVPTKAGEEAKIARKEEMDALWIGFGDRGAQFKRAMEICLEVNRSSVSKFKTMEASVAPDGRLHGNRIGRSERHRSARVRGHDLPAEMRRGELRTTGYVRRHLPVHESAW